MSNHSSIKLLVSTACRSAKSIYILLVTYYTENSKLENNMMSLELHESCGKMPLNNKINTLKIDCLVLKY